MYSTSVLINLSRLLTFPITRLKAQVQKMTLEYDCELVFYQ